MSAAPHTNLLRANHPRFAPRHRPRADLLLQRRHVAPEPDPVPGKFDLLLGRKTYEIFAAYWPYYHNNGGADAISIFTVPVVLGGGKKLFADGSVPHSYKLTNSRVSGTGLIIGHYERAGKINTGDADFTPNKAEAARQERMMREG